MSSFYSRLENIPYLFLDRVNKRQGQTIVFLTIEKNGIISDVRVIHGLSQEQDYAMIKAIKRLQKWKPGMQGGNPVRVQYAVPINFKLIND